MLRFLKLENPDIVFIIESRLKKEEFQHVKYKSGFNCCLSVDYRGKGKERDGCLILLWKENIQMNSISFFENHIRGSIADDMDSQSWFYIGIYGHPEEQNKRYTWILLQDLISSCGDRVLCVGDFNDIITDSEEVGGNCRIQSQLAIGRQTMDACGLMDMRFHGHPYTWKNGRKGDDNIQCHLDRAIATQHFLNRFSPTKVTHLSRFGSDHMTLRIELEADLGRNEK